MADPILSPPEPEAVCNEIGEAWVVYMIETERGTLYTGITTDLERRFLEHQRSKKGARFCRAHGAKSIRYVETSASRSEASKREAAIKKLTRAQKLELIQAASVAQR